MNDAMDYAKTHVTKVNQVSSYNWHEKRGLHLHAVTLHIRTVDVKSRFSRDIMVLVNCCME